VLLTTLVVVLQRPPPPVSADAPPERFSAVRAFGHVQVIAQEPRPTGSPANAEVREYLLATLSQLGLSTSVQDAVVGGTRIQNLLARLQGGQPGDQAVMLVAHHDSISSGPGAADNAAAVAALLETARALRAGPPPETRTTQARRSASSATAGFGLETPAPGAREKDYEILLGRQSPPDDRSGLRHAVRCALTVPWRIFANDPYKNNGTMCGFDISYVAAAACMTPSVVNAHDKEEG
jgi:hypothetical protein